MNLNLLRKYHVGYRYGNYNCMGVFCYADDINLMWPLGQLYNVKSM